LQLELKRQRTSKHSLGPPPKCVRCGATETPEWRSSEQYANLHSSSDRLRSFAISGPRTLCNACGIRERKQRLKDETQLGNLPRSMAPDHGADAGQVQSRMDVRFLLN
jgi:hypothetical protein